MKSIVIATLFFCVLTVQVAPLKSDKDPLVRHYREANYTTEQVLHELLKQQSLDHQADGQKDTRALNCHATAQYGGTGGIYFRDACHSAIKKIDIWSYAYPSQAELIRGIQIMYKDALNRDRIGTRHGWNDGSHHVVHLAVGEHIIAVVGKATTNGLSGRVKQLAFLTRGSGGVRNVFGPYGSESGTLFIVNANVVSIFGRSDWSVDAVGFFYIP